MRFRIDAQLFTDALSKIERAAPRRVPADSPLQVVKVEAFGTRITPRNSDGPHRFEKAMLVFTAWYPQCAVSVEVTHVNILVAGMSILPLTALKNAAQEIHHELGFETVEGGSIIFGDNKRYDFYTQSVEVNPFPELSSEGLSDIFECNIGDLGKSLRLVAPVVDDKKFPTPPIEAGARFERTESSLKIVASDDYRLAIVEQACAPLLPISSRSSFLLAPSSFQVLLKIALSAVSDDSKVGVCVGKEGVVVCTEDARYFFESVMKIVYHDYEKSIPQEIKISIPVDVHDVVQGICRAVCFGGRPVHTTDATVGLFFQSHVLILNSFLHQVAAAEIRVPLIGFKGKWQKFRCKAQILLDSFQMIELAGASLAMIKIAPRNGPVIIHSPDLRYSYLFKPTPTKEQWRDARSYLY